MRKVLLLLLVLTISTIGYSQNPADGKNRSLDSSGNLIRKNYPKKPASQEDLKIQRSMRAVADMFNKLDTSTVTLKKDFGVDFPNQLANTSKDTAFYFLGARVGYGTINTPSTTPPANTFFSSFVHVSDSIKIRFNNYSASAVNPDSLSIKIRLVK